MNATQSYHFIGLDIHKRTVAFCELNRLGHVVDQGTLAACKRELVAFAKGRRCAFVAGMEATMFTGWIYDVLVPYAGELHVGHPRRLKALTKNKNDRVDAHMLANLLRAELFPSCYMASPEVRELRRVLRHRNFMVQQATRMKNRAATILMEAGVEYAKSKLHGKRYFSELLDSLEEVPASVVHLLRMNRVLKAVRKLPACAATHVCCPNDAGRRAASCLRRVSRKLPILDNTPHIGRLSFGPSGSYRSRQTSSTPSNGKPPALPLDLYLSWRSHIRPEPGVTVWTGRGAPTP